MKTLSTIFFLLCCTLGLYACGQSGALYLPSESQSANTQEAL